MLTDTQIEEYRALLVERRAALQGLSAASSASRQPVELDQSRVGRLSRMDAMQDQAMALETARRRALELQRIESALKRLESGEYGDCLTCGEEIAEKRLRFDPSTPVCVGCAG
ncbi:MAG: TraR/DksA C4-type zinc finger protein [Alphaproteobacteria bacterium]